MGWRSLQFFSLATSLFVFGVPLHSSPAYALNFTDVDRNNLSTFDLNLPNPAAGKTSKADLLAALKASSDYCDVVYDSLTDAALAQPVKMFGRDISKQGALYFNVSHNNETYGTMVVYMRLKGIVPPSPW
jgi:hypothetical protein